MPISFTSGGAEAGASTPVVRISMNATTTVYLVGLARFTPGSCSVFGSIRARRVR